MTSCQPFIFSAENFEQRSAVKCAECRILTPQIYSLVYHCYFDLVLKTLTKKNPIAADIIVFWITGDDFHYVP